MGSKTGCYLPTCLIVINIVSSSCAAGQNQPMVVRTSPPLETTITPVQISPPLEITATSVPAIPTPTWGLNLRVGTTTPMPTATPTFVLPTLPPDCGKVKLGRAGTQIIDYKESILIQGIAIMCGATYVEGHSIIALPVLQSMFDLDTGTFNVEDADLQFCPGGGSTLYYYFCDINHTVVRKYQAYEKPKQPPFEECLGTKPYSGVDDDEAKYLCVVTTLGNISRVKVEQYNPVDDTLSFKISFITWKR
jgi:hypothetical protein